MDRTTFKPYIKFFRNLLIILALMVIIDQAAGALLRYYYFKQVAGANYRTTYSIDSTRADILVFGSSRASHHYVPQVFEDSLKMSFYNTGRDGNFLLYNYAVLKCVLKRYTPKIIILDITPDDLYYQADAYERLSSLLPYYKNHPEVSDIVLKRGKFEKLKLLSATYPYNSLAISIIFGNTKISRDVRNDDRGFIPLNGKLDVSTQEAQNEEDHLIDSLKIHTLASFAQLCNENDVRLYLIQSPVYGIRSNNKSGKFINEIATEYSAKFFDFIELPEFRKHSLLFQDSYHLNYDGALCFSALVTKELKYHPD